MKAENITPSSLSEQQHDTSSCIRRKRWNKLEGWTLS